MAMFGRDRSDDDFKPGKWVGEKPEENEREPDPLFEEPEDPFADEDEDEGETEEFEIYEYGSEEPIETIRVPAEDRLFYEEPEVATPEAEEASVGLYGKFHVERADGRDRPGGDKDDAAYFVLDYVNDPHARIAVRAYIDSLRDAGQEPELAQDLNQELGRTRRLHQGKRG